VVQPHQGGISTYFECDWYLRLHLLHRLWTQPTKLEQRKGPIFQRSMQGRKKSVNLLNFSKKNSFDNKMLLSRKNGSRKIRKCPTPRSRNLKAIQSRIGNHKLVRNSATAREIFRVWREMEPMVHELRAETYFGLIRLLKPGCRSIILLVDPDSKDVLLPQFAKYIYPLRK